MIKYFHQLTREQFTAWCENKPVSWGEFAKMYPQPLWCTYPDAVQGEMGCWSLMDFKVTNEEYCQKCEYYHG